MKTELDCPAGRSLQLKSIFFMTCVLSLSLTEAIQFTNKSVSGLLERTKRFAPELLNLPFKVINCLIEKKMVKLALLLEKKQQFLKLKPVNPALNQALLGKLLSKVCPSPPAKAGPGAGAGAPHAG